MESRRLVVDTNVIVSWALALTSKSGQAMNLASQSYDFVFSEETFHELEVVLVRKKFDRYLSLSLRREFLQKLRPREFHKPVAPVKACRDPRDDKFLALAQACGATALVTGDHDLLSMAEWWGIPILSPTGFVERFG